MTRRRTRPTGPARPAVGHGGRDSGQAALELALGLPIVLIALLGVVQVLVVIAHQMAVMHAARQGARAAAVSADPPAAGTTAATSSTAVGPLTVSVEVAEPMVTTAVSYTDSTDVALVGAFIPPITVHATVTMLLDPPP